MGRDTLVATVAYQPEPGAVAAARNFVRETLQAWQGSGHCAGRDDLVDDAVLLTSELVTNAVVHAGTSLQVMCRLADESVEVTVVDHRPVQLIPDHQTAAVQADRTSGRGLQLPAELASCWGVTYARTCKAVWFRMGVTDAARSGRAERGPGQGRPDEPEPGRQERVRFLAEAGDLLAVSLDARKVLVLGTQLAIAGFAAWSAVFLAEGGAAPRLAHAVHAEPSRTPALDWLLRRCGARAGRGPDAGPPPPDDGAAAPACGTEPAAGSRRNASPWHLPLWATGGAGPGRGDAAEPAGPHPMPPGAAELTADQAWCFPLVTASRDLGLLVIGDTGTGTLPGEVAELAEGLARRIAVALDNCGPQSWHQFTAAERQPRPARR